MLIVELKGRLGNQLFQYAFIFNAAKLLRKGFILYYYHYPELLSKYFELPSFNTKKNTIYNKLVIWLQVLNIKLRIANESEFINKIMNWTIYKGYFQSTLHFKDYENLLYKEFSIKRRFVNRYQKKFKNLQLSKKILVIHYRGRDYHNEQFKLPNDYYYSCLKKIDLQQFSVMVVSDDLEKAKQVFQGYKDFNFQSNEPIIDFQIIKNADVAIISNSSFAWWAAYLNQKKGKKITAPKYWLGYNSKKEYPDKIMSGLNWSWVE